MCGREFQPESFVGSEFQAAETISVEVGAALARLHQIPIELNHLQTRFAGQETNEGQG
jgi:hypothetical protein